MPALQQIISEVAKLAPRFLAFDWDNVGLQLGDTGLDVKKVLLTLDVTEGVIEEAVNNNCDLIISHHPLIFKGIKSINEQTKTGRIIMNAVSNEIAIYSAHTNLDIAPGGLNDYLARLLGIKDTVPLAITEEKQYYKLAVYIPEKHFGEVKETIFNNGAGIAGNYSHSSFSTDGTGTFKPLRGSSPYLGKEEKVASVREKKLETIVAEDKLNKVLNSLYEVHPYEEIAYDLYPLSNKKKKFGIGRIGDLENSIDLEKFIKDVKTKLQMKTVKLIGPVEKIVKRIAICTGAGSDYIKTAKYAGADLYLSGEIKYHEAQQAEDIGLSLIDAGHYKTEIIVKDLLAEYLIDKFADIDIIKSGINTDPWRQV